MNSCELEIVIVLVISILLKKFGTLGKLRELNINKSNSVNNNIYYSNNNNNKIQPGLTYACGIWTDPR